MKKTDSPRRGRPLKGSEKRIRTSFTLSPEQVVWLEKQARLLKISKCDMLAKLLDQARFSIAEMPDLLQKRFPISEKVIMHFCQKYHVKKLSLFGSILRKDFGTESDIDILVEFEEGSVPGFFTLIEMENEMSKLLRGRKIDIRTPSELSRYFRSDVMRDKETLYAA